MKTVLVVEDNRPIRDLLTKKLSEAGFGVCWADNGKTALEICDGADVVLLDLGLPVVSGEEVLKKLRAKKEWVPVVVISALSEEQGMAKIGELGVEKYYTKPLPPMVELVETIRGLAEMKENMEVLKRAGESISRVREQQRMVEEDLEITNHKNNNKDTRFITR